MYHHLLLIIIPLLLLFFTHHHHHHHHHHHYHHRYDELIIAETVVGISKPPSAKTKPSYLTLPSGARLFISMQGIEGSPAPAYQWYKNGIALPGETNAAYTALKVDRSYSGTYSCELSNVAGQFVWQEVAVSIT